MLQTEKVITRVAEADNEDVDAAVKAARKAFDEGAWPRTPGAQRARVLNKCASLPAALQVTSSREFAAAAADFAVIANYCVCNCASSSRCLHCCPYTGTISENLVPPVRKFCETYSSMPFPAHAQRS